MATGNAPHSVPGTMATGEQRCSLSRSAFDLNDLKIEENPGYDELKKLCGDILKKFRPNEIVPSRSECLALSEAFQSLILEVLEQEHSDWLVFVPEEDDDVLNKLVLEAIEVCFSDFLEEYNEKEMKDYEFERDKFALSVFRDKDRRATQLNIPFLGRVLYIGVVSWFDEYNDIDINYVRTYIEVETSWTEKGDTTEVDSEITKLEEELEGAKNALKSVSDNLACLSDPDDVLRQATELGSRLNQVTDVAGRLKLAKEKREAISGGSAAE